jgi:hypothetical protein
MLLLLGEIGADGEVGPDDRFMARDIPQQIQRAIEYGGRPVGGVAVCLTVFEVMDPRLAVGIVRVQLPFRGNVPAHALIRDVTLRGHTAPLG